MAREKVIEFVPGKAFKSAPPKPRRRKPAPKPVNDDPNAKNTDRTFEFVVLHACAEAVIEKRVRMRFKKGEPADNLYDCGDTEIFKGLVSEHLPNGKWSAYGWGYFKASSLDFVREIVEPEKKRANHDEHNETTKP